MTRRAKVFSALAILALAIGALVPVRTAQAAWQPVTALSLPFSETGYVTQGWGGEVTHTGKLEYALDFVILDSRWRSSTGSGKNVSDYYTWGRRILASADGVILTMAREFPDQPLNQPDEVNPWGNYLIIDHLNGEYSLIAHFKQNSIVVSPGQRVKQGDLLGLAGNSGYSLKPHIHYQLQNVGHSDADSLPVTFRSYYRITWIRETRVTDGTPQEGEAVRNTSQARPARPTPTPRRMR